MVTFGSTLRYFVYLGPVDFRNSYDGLHGLVQNHLGQNGLDGSVYIFFNRRRTQVKMLVWDRNGFVLYGKRLERGTFEHLGSTNASAAQSISWRDLQLLLEGVALQNIKQRKRYTR